MNRKFFALGTGDVHQIFAILLTVGNNQIPEYRRSRQPSPSQSGGNPSFPKEKGD